jgi:hypothetical protein
MIPDITLTTGCFYLGDFNKDARSLDAILENIKTLLAVPCYLHIFCNSVLYESLKTIRDSFGLLPLTHWTVQECKEIWTFQYFDKVNANRAAYWPTRDARAGTESHLICCNKFDFVLQTVQNNPFKTSKFGWIDSNIGKNGTKISEEFHAHEFLSLLTNVTDKFHLQILNVVDKKYKRPDLKREYYSRYQWLVCGCLFTVGIHRATNILQYLKEQFVKTTELGVGHGEEMLYLEFLDEFDEDIVRGYGDYKQILHNFLAPQRNLNCVYYIQKRYLDMGYNKECYELGDVLQRQFETYKIPMNYDLYAKTLFNKYVAAFYYCRAEAIRLKRHIQRLRVLYPEFEKEWRKGNPHYDAQLSLVP